MVRDGRADAALLRGAVDDPSARDYPAIGWRPTVQVRHYRRHLST
jgi:hypothetical protein